MSVKSAPSFDVEVDLGLRVIGVDEVGLGPWAGPIVVTAVLLNRETFSVAVTDSKRLTPARREQLYDVLCALPDLVFCTVEIPAETIDTLGLRKAHHQGIREAVEGLLERLHSLKPTGVLIDGNHAPHLPLPARTLVKGDSLSPSIAAASILAKVHRDRLMHAFHLTYPVYGFDRHVGYGTAAHQEALRLHGPCPLHRRSFRGVVG